VLLSVGVLLLVETTLREERERGIAADRGDRAQARGVCKVRPRCRVILGRAPDLHRKKHSTMLTRGTNTMAGRVANVRRMPAGGYGFSLVGTDQAGGWRVR